MGSNLNGLQNYQGKYLSLYDDGRVKCKSNVVREMESLQFIDYSPLLKVPVAVKDEHVYRSILQFEDYLIAISERELKFWHLNSFENEPIISTVDSEVSVINDATV